MIGILVLVIAMLVVVFAIIFNRRSDNGVRNFDNNNTIAQEQQENELGYKENEELEGEYEETVPEILSTLLQDGDAARAREDLLSVRVPDKYRSLHLDLVIVFEKMERGKETTDQALIEEAYEGLDDIISKYEWLSVSADQQ